VARAALTAVVALLLAAGCGGGDTAASGPAKTHLNAADGRLARTMLIRASDVGAGWTEERTDDSGHDRPCDLAAGELTVTGHPDGTQLSKGRMTEVMSDASVFQSESQAGEAFERASDGSFIRCLGRQLEREVRSGAQGGATVGRVHVRELSPPDAGDDSRGYRLRLPVHTNGIAFSFYFDLHVIRRGRGVGLLALVSGLHPLTPRSASGCASAWVAASRRPSPPRRRRDRCTSFTPAQRRLNAPRLGSD
jgi:hypothetical protein